MCVTICFAQATLGGGAETQFAFGSECYGNREEVAVGGNFLRPGTNNDDYNGGDFPSPTLVGCGESFSGCSQN